MTLRRVAAAGMLMAAVLTTAGAASPFAGDALQRAVVVQADSSLAVFDGDTLQRIAAIGQEFRTAPRLSPDGRYAHVAAADGWVRKYDLDARALAAETRVGFEMRGIALAADGKWLAVANGSSPSIVILDARNLKPVKVIPVSDARGRVSRVAAIHDAAPRRSFMVTLEDVPEAWEIPYAADAEPVYEGLVHDYRSGEAIVAKGPFPVRRIPLDGIHDKVVFDAAHDHMLGRHPGATELSVVNLNVRRRIAGMPLSGAPDVEAGLWWSRSAGPVIAFPDRNAARLAMFDARSWQPGADVGLPAPVRWLRSHPSVRYVFTAGAAGAESDTVAVLDKETLKVVARLQPVAGRPVTAIAVTADGRQLLAGTAGDDGALVSYDAATLLEIRRVPANGPTLIGTVPDNAPARRRR